MMDLSIVIPAYNESENILTLLNDLEKLVEHAPCRIQVLVVDDGSQDGTWEIVNREMSRRSWLVALRNSTNQGMGSALKLGTVKAKYLFLAWIMADRTDRLEDIWSMYDKLVNGADLVVASRAIQGGSYGDLVSLKAWGSRLFSSLARWVLNLPVHDSTNAFRVFRRSLFEELHLERDDFAISPEMVFKAVAGGKRVEEVPTVYFFRMHGMSNFSILHMSLVYLRLVFTHWIDRHDRGEGNH